MPDATHSADCVAVLIPVFNDDGRLVSTLRSIGADSGSTVVVVVDDGSRSPLTIDPSVCAHEVIVIRHDVNRGIEHALNTGLRYIESRGVPYVARLDNGDQCAPGRLTRQRQFLQHHPQIHLVGSAAEWRDDAGRTRFTRVLPTTHEEIVRALHHTTPLIHPSIMFRTSVIGTAGAYSTAYPAAEDLEFFWRVATRHRVANFAETLVVTRFDPAGISMRRRRTQLASTLRIQLAHFDPWQWTSYFGILRTLGRLALPYRIIVGLKRLASRRDRLVPA
jgi:glycosyltransferase involved in cell wall biosynthesis